jgi:hypothetical protein
VKLGMFFPAAVGLVLLWFGGVWMFVLPFINRRRVRRHKAGWHRPAERNRRLAHLDRHQCRVV